MRYFVPSTPLCGVIPQNLHAKKQAQLRTRCCYRHLSLLAQKLSAFDGRLWSSPLPHLPLLLPNVCNSASNNNYCVCVTMQLEHWDRETGAGSTGEERRVGREIHTLHVLTANSAQFCHWIVARLFAGCAPSPPRICVRRRCRDEIILRSFVCEQAYELACCITTRLR